MAVLQDLRRVRARLSVDDFATGQSSLAYLKNLPVDEGKIDSCIRASMTRHAGGAAILVPRSRHGYMTRLCRGRGDVASPLF